jgi:hypothetical protein
MLNKNNCNYPWHVFSAAVMNVTAFVTLQLALVIIVLFYAWLALLAGT